MLHFNYKTKKDLKASVGKRLNYTETSMFGSEYRSTGVLTGSQPVQQPMWFARVTLVNGLITKVQ